MSISSENAQLVIIYWQKSYVAIQLVDSITYLSKHSNHMNIVDRHDLYILEPSI